MQSLAVSAGGGSFPEIVGTSLMFVDVSLAGDLTECPIWRDERDHPGRAFLLQLLRCFTCIAPSQSHGERIITELLNLEKTWLILWSCWC